MLGANPSHMHSRERPSTSMLGMNTAGVLVLEDWVNRRLY